MKKIYLDYAATTPVDSAVLAAMKPYFSGKFGNAGSLHSWGQEAAAAIDNSREKVAESIGADFREIIFTGSATEANNLAILGVAKSLKTERGLKTPKVIVSSVEHESILETARDLARLGMQMVYLGVDRDGLVDLEQLKKELDERVILVSVMYANNEVGTIQPIEEINRLISEFRKNKTENRSKDNSTFYFPGSGFPLLHVDAAQAFQYLDCDVRKLGVDLMTLSAHKIYGPKGIGALFVDLKTRLEAIISGGKQEYGLRSGTENIPLVVGFAKAVELAEKNRGKEAKRIAELRDYFWKQLKRIYPKAEINGFKFQDSGFKNRLPNNLNIYFPGQKAEDLLIKFDLAGIAVSAGSACSARGTEPSHVLKACGFPLERIKSSLRITLGRPTTKTEIKEALRRIRAILNKEF